MSGNEGESEGLGARLRIAGGCPAVDAVAFAPSSAVERSLQVLCLWEKFHKMYIRMPRLAAAQGHAFSPAAETAVSVSERSLGISTTPRECSHFPL